MSFESPTNCRGESSAPEEAEAVRPLGDNTGRIIDHSALLLPTSHSGEGSNNRHHNNNMRYDVPTTPMDVEIAQAWISSAPGNQYTMSEGGSQEGQFQGTEKFQDEFVESIQSGRGNDDEKTQRRILHSLKSLRKNLFSSSDARAHLEMDRESSHQINLGWRSGEQHQPETAQHHLVEQYDSGLAQNDYASMPSTPPLSSMPSTPPSFEGDLMILSSKSNKSEAKSNNTDVRHSYGQTPVPDKESSEGKTNEDGPAGGSFKAVASPGEIAESAFAWVTNPEGSIPTEIILDDDQQANMENELLTGDGGENSININNKNNDSGSHLFRPPTLGGALSRPVPIQSEDRQITPQSWHTPISLLPRAIIKRSISGGSSRRTGMGVAPLSPVSRRSTKSEKYYHSYQTNIEVPPKSVPPFVVVRNSGSAVVTVNAKRTTLVPENSRKLKNKKHEESVDPDFNSIIAEESITNGKEANCGCDGEEAKVWCKMWGRPVTTALASAVLALSMVTIVTSLVASRFQSNKKPQLRPVLPNQPPVSFPSSAFPDFSNDTASDLDKSFDELVLRPYEGTQNPVQAPTLPPRTFSPTAHAQMTIPTFAPTMLPDNFPEYVPTEMPFWEEPKVELGLLEDQTPFQIPWNNYVIGLLSVESPDTFIFFDDPTSAQFLALQWISVDSSRKGGSSAYTMDASLQRFALATVYFSLDGIDSWFDNGDWLSTVVPVCNWSGITCDSSNTAILSLNLPSNNLSGTLPEEIKLLKYLQVLNLPENAIAGSLPSAMSRLHELVELDLSRNFLTGSIPAEFVAAGAFEFLEVLDISHNGIEGNIPSRLGNLKSLEKIRVCANALTGTIPSVLSSMAELRSIKLGNNDLTGYIPGGICDLTSEVVFDCTVDCECCTSCCDVGEECC